jgi:hypothetical protein
MSLIVIADPANAAPGPARQAFDGVRPMLRTAALSRRAARCGWHPRKRWVLASAKV